MGKKLTNNLALKIGSVLFAGILWLLVTNINNPSTPIYFTNVPVQIINSNLITSQGKMFEVLDDTDVIDSVTLMVPRSLTDSMSSEDNIVAIADMNNLTNLNTIHIEISTRRNQNSVSSISTSNDILKLNIEDKKNISIPLTTSTSGSLPEEYIVGAVTPDQNLVRVSGPESVVSQILATKAVPLKFSTSGVPADGFQATGVVRGSVSAVLLAGKANVLNNLSVIEIPDTELDLTGAEKNVTVTFDIEKYLPGSVDLADAEFDGKVSVTAYVEKKATRTFGIPERNIAIENVPEGYTARVTAYGGEASIRVQGLAANVNAVEASQIRAFLDISQLTESGVLDGVEAGNYDVPLSIELPETVELRENVTVRLVIEEVEESAEEE